MKRSLLLIVTVLLCGDLYAQVAPTSGRAAIVHSRFRSADSGGVPNDTNAITTLQYFDGLGNLMQTVGYRQSPAGKDIVLSSTEYNRGLQPVRSYLAFPMTTGTGDYQSSVLSPAQSFYGDTVPYDETLRFDLSPLGEVREARGPGQAWKTAGRTVKTASYSGSNIKLITVDGSGNLVFNNRYIAFGRYWTEIVTDEQNNQATKVTDMNGRVVETRDALNQLTLYVYDGRDRLAAVIQPQAYNFGLSITKDSDTWQKYVFGYEYDLRNRVIRKHIPGEGWTEIVYDKADRPVMQQNARQKALNRWTFWQYDAFSREIAKGEMQKTTTRASAQALFDAQTITCERWEDWAYTELSFPTSLKPLPEEIERYYFYDNYLFIASEFAFKPSGAFHPQKTNAVGLLTGVAKRNSRDDAVYYTDTYYYDDFSRRIQTQHVHQKSITNHSNVIVKNYQYSFSGEVLKEYVTYPFPTGTVEVKTHNVYDYRGRLIKIYHGINTSPAEIVRYSYDEAGRMSQKKYMPNGTYTASGTSINGLQTIDYGWHIRGGLSGINLNGSGNAVPNASQGDLFSYKLEYETAGRWDGTVGRQQWNHVVSNSAVGLRSYTFSYDAAKQLGKATYSGLGSENYSLLNMKYDFNGNIMGLQRWGKTGSSTYGAIDRLGYTYSGNRLTNVIDTVITGYDVDLIPHGSGNYTYEANGNLKTDDHSQITNISYNSYLNQPDEISLTSSRWIKYTYNGNDELLKAGYSTGEYWEYADIFVFKNGSPYQMTVPEGRAVYSGGSWLYEFDYQDHLGNTRVSFGASGSTLQRTAATDFDPWGVRLNGTGVVNSFQNRWELQGKEKEMTFGLNRVNFGARVYNPTIGRFDRVDPLAEYAVSWTSYHFVYNSPSKFIDPSGMFAEEPDPPGSKKKEDPLVQGFINYGKSILSFGRSLFSNPGGTLGGIGQGVAQGLSNFVNLDGGNLANTITRTGGEALEGYVNRVAGSSDPGYESQVVLGELAAEVTVGALLTKGATGLASKGAVEVVVEGGVSNVAARESSNILLNTSKQLQAKFKHAGDFGVAGNYSKANAGRYSSAINQHINSAGVQSINGLYRGQSVIHYVNPNTGLNVISSPSGHFISGWKLNPAQLQNVLKHGGL